MTMLKTKHGKEINTDDFKFYGFGDYVRKNIDENWGLGKSVEQNKTKMYRVTLVASVSATAYCTKKVEAESEEEAGELAKEYVHLYDWNGVEIENVRDFDVDEVEEINTDE